MLLTTHRQDLQFSHLIHMAAVITSFSEVRYDIPNSMQRKSPSLVSQIPHDSLSGNAQPFLGAFWLPITGNSPSLSLTLVSKRSRCSESKLSKSRVQFPSLPFRLKMIESLFFSFSCSFI
jgi:hypothetical protein